MHQAAIDVRHVCRKNRRQAAAQLDEPDRRPGSTTRSLSLCSEMGLSVGTECDDIARTGRFRKRQRHRDRRLDADRARSLLCDDQVRRTRTAQHRKFMQPLVVKALHGQSEQNLARGVNTNRPSRLQFAQGAADAEVLLVAKQGRVCRRVRGVHSGGLLLLGAFVEHRKS
jgi:hypothetical protein